jgi:pSer/pThr/pTyr-binding forkhead associated (FHA) protein
MAGAKVPLTFRIYKGEQLLREETLDQQVIKVGKLSSSHLRLDDESVSRMHAVIEVSAADDISIIDLGSTKGTLVNGQKVNKARLQEGDQIALGDIRIELSIGAADAFATDDAPTKVNVPSAPPATPADSGVVASAPPAPLAAPPPPAAAAPPPPAAAAAPPPPRPAPPAATAPPPPGIAPPPGIRPAAAPAAFAAAPPPAFGADSVDDMGGARAIEVAAMLGDSVVAVKHVMNPRGGKVTSTTYGLFGCGAALLLLSAIAFFIGVGNAADNKVAQHHWTEVQKRPMHEFRPKRISLGFDWMAFGGAAGGLICLTMGLIRFRNEKVEPYFRIGRAAGVDFPTDSAMTEAFPLVAPSGDDFVFNFNQQMTGEMILDGQSTELGELQSQGRARGSATAAGAFEVPIPPKARFRVTAGTQTFLVSSVPQPRKHVAPLFATLETAVLTFFGGSALVHLGILALLFSIPPDPRSLSLDRIGADGRLSRVQSKPQEDPKQEEEEIDNGKEDDSGGTGTKMALTEGKMGKKESTRQSGQFAMKDNKADPQLAKQQALDRASKAGILGILQQRPGGAFASLTGTGDFSSGLDDRDVYGGLIGNEVGEMAGGWGYGISGVGPGGGGTGWGTIGTGRYGTIGHGSGTGSGYGTGSGRGGMRGRKARPPQVRIGNATATGDLDKNIIRRYIRRKLPQIRHCYEKQLLVKPSLAGTVVTQFQISPQGKVQGASASGIGDKGVESCVAGAIRSIQFPKPKGGGFVNVRYPFTFRPAGG